MTSSPLPLFISKGVLCGNCLSALLVGVEHQLFCQYESYFLLLPRILLSLGTCREEINVSEPWFEPGSCSAAFFWELAGGAVPFRCAATSCTSGYINRGSKWPSVCKALGLVCGPVNSVLVNEFLPSYAYSHLCSTLIYLAIITTLGLWYYVIIKITHYYWIWRQNIDSENIYLVLFMWETTDSIGHCPVPFLYLLPSVPYPPPGFCLQCSQCPIRHCPHEMVHMGKEWVQLLYYEHCNFLIWNW